VALHFRKSVSPHQTKWRRGELFLTVAVGYVKAGGDRIEKDPDQRVQEAIALVFRKFAELQTIRQVLVWCRQEKILLPSLVQERAAAERIVWRLPVYPTVHHILTNPVYAGAYAFGRRTARVTIENGRKRVIRSMQRDRRSWDVLICDHHEGYISWAEFERNQQLIADNANGKRFMSRGAIRPGEALLPGLFRCARCGKKLHVRYGQTYRYECVGAFNQFAAARCITFGGMRVDRVIAKEVLDRLQPLGVEAALAVIDTRNQRRSEKEVVIDVADKTCPYCGGLKHRIGEDVSERLDVTPAQFKVLVLRRPKYACRACEGEVSQAPAPERLIENGIPTEALVAHSSSPNMPITCRFIARRRFMPERVLRSIARP
jgi:zinc-finger binding domain of transposase IS66/Recombinase